MGDGRMGLLLGLRVAASSHSPGCRLKEAQILPGSQLRCTLIAHPRLHPAAAAPPGGHWERSPTIQLVCLRSSRLHTFVIPKPSLLDSYRWCEFYFHARICFWHNRCWIFMESWLLCICRAGIEPHCRQQNRQPHRAARLACFVCRASTSVLSAVASTGKTTDPHSASCTASHVMCWVAWSAQSAEASLCWQPAASLEIALLQVALPAHRGCMHRDRHHQALPPMVLPFCQ